MSRFTSIIPTEVQAFIDSLPKGSYTHSVKLDEETKNVTVTWENSLYESGLTVPVDFPREQMAKKRLPEGVFNLKHKKPAPTEKVITDFKPGMIVPPNAVIAPHYLSQEEFEQAMKEGKPVEFMGIEPKWKPVTAADEFKAGYFYRIAI